MTEDVILLKGDIDVVLARYKQGNLFQLIQISRMAFAPNQSGPEL